MRGADCFTELVKGNAAFAVLLTFLPRGAVGASKSSFRLRPYECDAFQSSRQFTVRG